MKRKTVLFSLAVFLFSGMALVWVGGSRTGSNYKILLIGMDGASWDIVRHLASQNKLPNIQKLLQRGASGYLDSLQWKKRTGTGTGYFSPIVWSTIATGKYPSKHGVEDFKLPLPSSASFRMGYEEEEKPVPAILEFPFHHKDDMLLVVRAKAPLKMKQTFIRVYFNDQQIGSMDLTDRYQDFRFPITAERIGWHPNQLRFSYEETRRAGKKLIGAEIEYMRVYNSTGQEVFDYSPIRHKHFFIQGWANEASKQFALASSYHLRTRTLWEIASHFNKRISVIGWWATWPAYKVNGYLVTNNAGLQGERSGRDFLEALPDLTYPTDFVKEIKPLYKPKYEMIPEFNRLFFEMGKCECVGSVQERIVLTRFWQDRYFGDIAKYILDNKGDFDLFAVYFRGTDTMAHQFIGFSEDRTLLEQECMNKEACDLERLHHAVHNYYVFIDGQIGEILKRIGRNTITFIVTDHGEAAAGRKGTHKNNGFIVAAGPGIRKHTFQNASVLDVTPTILYLLNLPLGQDMDGHVMEEAFERRMLLERPIAYIDSYDSIVRAHGQKVVVDQELEEQDTEELKALGYIN